MESERCICEQESRKLAFAKRRLGSGNGEVGRPFLIRNSHVIACSMVRVIAVVAAVALTCNIVHSYADHYPYHYPYQYQYQYQYQYPYQYQYQCQYHYQY